MSAILAFASRSLGEQVHVPAKAHRERSRLRAAALLLLYQAAEFVAHLFLLSQLPKRQRRVTSAILVLMLSLAPIFADNASALQVGEKIAVRALADGAGPSHIFWLDGPRPEKSGFDIVGVVDPLYAAIRFFSVDRRHGESTPDDHRFNEMGVCALPINFVPWRIHQFKKSVVIEGMPQSSSIKVGASAASFRSSMIVLNRKFLDGDRLSLAKQSASRIETSEWDPAAALKCGRYSQRLFLPARISSYEAVRGRYHPQSTIILFNKFDALAPAAPLIVRASGKRRLFSARELEPTSSRRIVQATQGEFGGDGIIRFSQRLIIFKRNGGGAKAEFVFDESLLRTKLAEKPLSVLPSGELLLLGRFGSDASFSIQSCGNILLPLSSSARVCPEIQNNTGMPHNVPVSAGSWSGNSVKFATKTISAQTIFSSLLPYYSKAWSVDASKLPNNCRTPKGCSVPGQDASYVPIRGVRLSHQIFNRKGAPYAQTEDLEDVRKFLRSPNHKMTLALQGVTDGVRGVPGNLNDDYDGDIGIDCSALLQIGWTGNATGPRLTTRVLQSQPIIPYRCPARVPDVTALRPGDAIALNVQSDISHVVIFRSQVELDGANAVWLVLESSSSCDGVCWTFYDPGFFNGWGLYRAAGRSDAPCPPEDENSTSIADTPIPRDPDKWRVVLRSGFVKPCARCTP